VSFTKLGIANDDLGMPLSELELGCLMYWHHLTQVVVPIATAVK